MERETEREGRGGEREKKKHAPENRREGDSHTYT